MFASPCCYFFLLGTCVTTRKHGAPGKASNQETGKKKLLTARSNPQKKSHHKHKQTTENPRNHQTSLIKPQTPFSQELPFQKPPQEKGQTKDPQKRDVEKSSKPLISLWQLHCLHSLLGRLLMLEEKCAAGAYASSVNFKKPSIDPWTLTCCMEKMKISLESSNIFGWNSSPWLLGPPKHRASGVSDGFGGFLDRHKIPFSISAKASNLLPPGFRRKIHRCWAKDYKGLDWWNGAAESFNSQSSRIASWIDTGKLPKRSVQTYMYDCYISLNSKKSRARRSSASQTLIGP